MFSKIKSFWEMFHLIVCHYKRNSAINDLSMSFRWLLQPRHCCCCCCCGRIFPILFVVNDNWHQRREMPRLTGNHRLADNVDWQQSFHWPPTKDENECQNNNWWKFKGWFSTEFNFFKKDQQKSYSPNVGLEPTTLRLRVSCSTDWASRAMLLD